MTIVCALLGYFCNDFIEIIGTASIGSFLIFRAFGVAFDNYPDYSKLATYIKNKDYDMISNWFYVYLALTVVFAILGAIV